MNEQTVPKPWYKKWWAITLFVFFGVIVIGSLVNKSNESQSNAPIQNEETSEEPKNELKSSATIPGLSAVDVYGNLKNIEFSCSGPDIGSDGLTSWECKEETGEHMYLVEILGKNSSEILTVQATALNYSNINTDDVVKDFFGYVASVPYENSDQVFAKNWVIQNIAQKTNEVINRVRFTMAGNEKSRILTIANENSDLD